MIPKRATRIFLLASAFAVLTGTLSLYLFLRSPFVERWIAEQIESLLEEELHEQASIRRARIRFLPLGLELRDVALTHRPTGEDIVTVKRAQANLAFRDWTIKLGQVAVIEPKITLHLDERGKLREFRIPPRETPRRPLKELPWGSFLIDNAVVTLHVPDGEVQLTQLSLMPTQGTAGHLRALLSVKHGEFTDDGAIAWDHMVLGPDRIAVPDLVLAMRSLRITGRAEIPLDGDLDGELRIRSRLAEFTPLLPGPRTLDGTLNVGAQISGPPLDPHVYATIHVEDLEYTAPGKVWPRVRYQLDEADIEVEGGKSGFDIRSLTVRQEQGYVRGTGRIEPVDRGIGPRWELTESAIVGEEVSLAAILRAGGAAPNPWVDFRGEARVRLTGPLAPLQLDGPFEVFVRNFEVRQGPVDKPDSPINLGIDSAEVAGDLTIYKDHLVLNAQRFVTAKNRGRVIADIGFGPFGPLDLRADLTSANLAELRPLGSSALQGRGRISGRLRGDFNKLRATGAGVIDGFSVGGVRYADHLEANLTSDLKTLTLTQVSARVGRTPYTGSFSMNFVAPGLPMDTTVRMGEGRIEDLLRPFLDLESWIEGDVVQASLTLVGSLNDLDGEADLELGAVRLLGERFERGRAKGRMHDGTFTLDEITARRGADEGLTMRGSVGRNWALDMVATAELRLENMDALGSNESEVSGRASALLHIDNTLLDPAPHGRVRLWQTRLAGQPLPDSLFEGLTRDGVLLGQGSLIGDSISLNVRAGLWGDQPYEVRAQLDRLPIDKLYPEGTDGSPISAWLSGDLVLSGNGGPSPSFITAKGIFPDAQFAWGRHRLTSDPTRPWTLTAEDGRWTLRDVSLRGGANTLSLVAGGRGETILLDGAGSLDADLLRAVVPGLQRAEGTLDLTFTSRGGLATRAEIALDASLLRHESVPAAFEDFHARATLTPERFTLTHLQTELGGGTITGAARRLPRVSNRFQPGSHQPLGIVEADNWRPTRFDLLADARNVQLQWVKDLPPAVGNAQIAFDGPADRLLMHGEIDVTEMAFTERINWEDWVVALEEHLLVEAPPSDAPPWFGFDLGIMANRTVRLLNNVSDATASADLRLVGDTSRMGLTGRVRVEDGVIFLQDRAFDVLRGELRFDDPFAWDPLLDFDFRTDIQSRSRRYRINYRIGGPYSSWTSRTLSEPRLPQADINALLWFGVTADELEDMGELTSAIGMAAADFMFKDFVQNDYLGLGLRDSTLFERLPRVEINTGVNLRGEYSSEPRALIRQRWSPSLTTLAEINLIRDDHFARLDWRTDSNVLLSAWWASRRREGLAIPMSGALGVDARWVIEVD